MMFVHTGSGHVGRTTCLWSKKLVFFLAQLRAATMKTRGQPVGTLETLPFHLFAVAFDLNTHFIQTQTVDSCTRLNNVQQLG